MSLCYRFSKNIDESIKSLDKAVELAVGPHLKRNLRKVRAIGYNLNGDHDKAKVEYEKLVKDYPDAPGLAYWNREIASCYWRQKDYPNCFRALRKAIASAKYPEMKKSWEIGCGVRAYQVRDYDTVVSVLAEPARESSNIDLGRLVGRSYINLRDWEKALSTYQMLDEKSPQHRVEWRLWTAYCYEQQGKYQKAESIYRGLISKYAKDDSVSCAYYRLGRCLVKEGKAKEAQALLDAYYRDGSHKPEAIFWEAATLTVEMQQYKEALSVLNKYLSDYPKHDLVEEANWLMVSSLLHTSQLDQAKSVAEALLEREKAGNQVTSDLKIDDDLDMFPETGDKVVAQFVSIDDLVHAPQESLARARYAIGHLCQKEGNCDLAERLMRSVIDQYPNCATAKEARVALDLWQKVGTKNP